MMSRMTISRTFEEGMYIIREDDCLWRIDEDGRLDSSVRGLTSTIEQLAYIQQWRIPSRRIFRAYPLEDASG